MATETVCAEAAPRETAGLRTVDRLLVEWSALRAALRDIQAAEHPDVVDVRGRVWTWWDGDLYRTPRPDLYPIGLYRSEVGQSAVPLDMIEVAADGLDVPS